MVSTVQPDHAPYRLGRRRGADNPKQWRYQLIPTQAPDPSVVRSLAKLWPEDFDQGDRGACTSNAGVSVQLYCGAYEGVPMPVPVLSRVDLYYWERVADGDCAAGQPCPDDGATVSDSIDVSIKKGGLVLEPIWPYTDADIDGVPPAADATAPRTNYIKLHQPISLASGWQAVRDAALTALDADHALVLGMNWYEGFFADYEQNGLLARHAGDSIAGGHEIAIKGAAIPSATHSLPNGGAVCQNSWGPTSPVRTDLWPDSRAGDVIIPWEMFDGLIVDELRSVVPLSAQPVLSVTITGPLSAVVGASETFVAAVAGVPPGEQATVTGDFGDGASGSGLTVSHRYATAGSVAVVATATLGQTHARSQITVTVAPVPVPVQQPFDPTSYLGQWLNWRESLGAWHGQPIPSESYVLQELAHGWDTALRTMITQLKSLGFDLNAPPPPEPPSFPIAGVLAPPGDGPI